MKNFSLVGLLILLLAGPSRSHAISVADLGPAHQLKLLTQHSYMPGIPVLVRVEVWRSVGEPERELWDAEATLSNDGGLTLLTNRVQLRNGLGSALVIFSGGDFSLTAQVGALQATRALVSLADAPVTTVGGILPAGSTEWSGVIRVTSDVTVPAGSTLTIQSNTLVLLEGVTSGTVANDLLIRGTINSLGSEDMPVTLTCAAPNARWGQIRHDSAQPSLYRYTSVTRAGRAPAEGHTGTAPVFRPANSSIRFENCNLTDFAEQLRGAPGFGTPGKVMVAEGSDLVFDHCLLARARMGPEVSGTALLCTNTWITDMPGPDDADGIYIHGQSGGQQVLFTGCVIADGDDDGIDTLGSVIDVQNCIIRDWNNLLEDAKGISILDGQVRVRHTLIVNSTVGVSAKTGGSAPSSSTVRVAMNNCTLSGNLTNVLANRKSSAVGPNVHLSLTNCVLWNGVAVHSDFEPDSASSTNFTLAYCDLPEPYPGEGNLMADPLFVNAASNDYRLQPYSPCIDSGDPISTPDPDGSRADMGYFVFQPPRPILSSPQMLGDGTFQFVLQAYTNRNYVLESSETATNWVFLKTIFQSAENDLATDASATNSTLRLYRVRLAP